MMVNHGFATLACLDLRQRLNACGYILVAITIPLKNVDQWECGNGNIKPHETTTQMTNLKYPPNKKKGSEI